MSEEQLKLFKEKIINIIVEGGCVVDVEGLPEGWEYAITDVDDKTIQKAQDENNPLKEITDKYTAYFMEDLAWLKMIPADHYPKATESIPKMIRMIEILLEKEYAYREDDGSVYFNIG